MFEFTFDALHRIKKRYAGNIDLARIPFVSTIRKHVMRLARKKIVENVNGFTMHVDDNDSLALSWHRVFEPGTTGFFKNNIESGQTIIDLGANIGYFTLLFSQLTGQHGRVYAFEPESENVNLLRKNVAINSCCNVIIEEMAIGDQSGKCRLYINNFNRGNHQLFDAGEKRNSIEVKTTSLDEYFAGDDPKIDWIKMDIEGAEMLALCGMKNIIRKNPNLILVTEINSEGLSASGSSVQEYVHELNKLGFEFEEINERHNLITPLTPEELIRSFSSRTGHPNIICTRAVYS